MKKLVIVLFVLFVGLVPANSQVPKWTQEFDEPITQYHFLKDGENLLLISSEYTWLYDAKTGKKIYELKIKDFEPKGVQELLGEKYLVSTDEKLQCYDAPTGKLLWEQAYQKIDQDEFKDISWLGNTCVVRYAENHLGIDLNNGKELWRTPIKYNGDAPVNYLPLEKQGKLLALLSGEKAGLFEFATGKQVFDGKEYEINSDLIKKNRTWYYVTPDEDFALFLLDEHLAIIDVKQNKEIVRHPIEYDDDFEAIMPTDLGCVILGEKKVVFFNSKTGGVAEVKASVGDFRTYEIRKIQDKEIFFAGLSDAMFAIDLLNGKILWQTREKDPVFDGYAHRYLKVIGTNLLITYNSGGSQGNNIYLMSIDALTGKVNYKTPPLANSSVYNPSWARSFQKFLGGEKMRFSWGYENIGYEYSIFEYKNNLIFGIVHTYKMRNPETKEDGGEGICVIDPNTGKILFKDYLELSDQTYNQPKKPKEFPPALQGKYLCLLGDENIAVYDLDANKRLWYSKETLKGIPRDAVVVDGIMYVKFGGRKFKVTLSPAKNIFDSMGMKVEDEWDEDPYGFAAYDVEKGTLLWRTETKMDPAFLTPQFSLENNYDSVLKRLYFGDESNIYALQLKRDGGKYDFTIDLEKNKIGEMPFKKTYAIQEWPIGSVSVSISTTGFGDNQVTTVSTTEEIGGKEYGRFISAAEEADAFATYSSWFTVWGAAAKKCLRVVYNEKQIFAVGKEAIAMINAEDGKVLWRHEWEYDQDNVQFMPKILIDKLVYCVERKLTSVDLKTGKTRWEAKEAKRPLFLVSPNDKYIFTIDEDVIKGYEL